MTQDTRIQAGQPPFSAKDHSAAQQSHRSALFIVFLVVFIDLLGFGIVLPLLPLFGDRFLQQLFEGGKEAPLGGLVLGLLMCSFSAMQFFFAPIWGRVSDRRGRRPILLLGLAGSVLFYTLFGFAADIPGEQAVLALALLFAARIGAGIAGATIATAQAVIADCTPPERRKHGMALIGAAFGIGFTFGPLIGFAALEFFPDSLGGLGFVAAGLSLLSLLLGLRLLPETRQEEAALADRKLDRVSGLLTALRTPALGLLILTFFLATFGFAGFESTLSLLNQDTLQLSFRQNFLVFAYVGFILMLTQGVLYRRLATRVSEATFIGLGILLMGMGVGALGATTILAGHLGFGMVLTWQLASLAFAVIGFAFLTPSVQALISRRTDSSRQGEILGANQSAAALARILGPVAGLTLYKLHPSHLLPFAFGAGILLILLPLVPLIRRQG